VRKRFKQTFIAALALVVSACMTAQQTPTEVELSLSDERFGLADIHLGDLYTPTTQKLASTYSDDPRCEDRMVGVVGTRQAVGMQICEYKPKAVQVNGAPVVRVVSYFADTILVRLDIDAQGSAALLSASQNTLQSNWPTSKRRPLNATTRDETVWTSGTDELALSYLERAELIEYRLRDTRLKTKMPWLFE